MTRRGRLERRAVALTCVFLLSLPLVAEARGRASLRVSLRRKLASLSRSMVYGRSRLRETKQEQRSVTERLRIVQQSLQRTRDGIKLAQVRLTNTHRRLVATERRLREVEASLREHTQVLAQRLVRDRRSQSSGYLSVALGATDFWDYLERERFLGRMVQSDVDLIRVVQAEKAEVDQQRSELQHQRQLQAILVRQLAEQEVAQKRQAWQEQALLEEIQEDRAELERALAEQEEASEQVSRMLDELSRTPEGRARASVPWTGRFSPPVSGRITSRFGYRVHPVLGVRKLHTGVDFAVPSGTAVRAAGSGVVVHAGWLGAYGNAVIIDHGGGVSTLYGHNSSVRVSVGQSVSQGDVVASSGSTGYSTGPHVHFEVRRGGRPVNPMY